MRIIWRSGRCFCLTRVVNSWIDNRLETQYCVCSLLGLPTRRIWNFKVTSEPRGHRNETDINNKVFIGSSTMQVLPVFVAVFRRYSLRWCRLRYKSDCLRNVLAWRVVATLSWIMVVMKFPRVFKHVYALLLFLSASSMLPLYFRGRGGRGEGEGGEGAGRDGICWCLRNRVCDEIA